jgi:hypothetical protein
MLVAPCPLEIRRAGREIERISRVIYTASTSTSILLMMKYLQLADIFLTRSYSYLP